MLRTRDSQDEAKWYDLIDENGTTKEVPMYLTLAGCLLWPFGVGFGFLGAAYVALAADAGYKKIASYCSEE